VRNPKMGNKDGNFAQEIKPANCSKQKTHPQHKGTKRGDEIDCVALNKVAGWLKSPLAKGGTKKRRGAKLKLTGISVDGSNKETTMNLILPPGRARRLRMENSDRN